VVLNNNETANGFKVSISAVDNGAAGLATWDTYTIYYRAGTSGNYASVNTNSANYAVGGLTPTVTYQVYVVARDNLGNVSASSGVQSVTVAYAWNKYTLKEDITWSRKETESIYFMNVGGYYMFYEGSESAQSENELTFSGGGYIYSDYSNSKYEGKWLQLRNGFAYITGFSHADTSDEMIAWSSVHLLKQVNTTAETFISIVTSANSDAYPTNGKHTDGYWYIKQ